MIIFIDTGVLGLLSSPNKREEVTKGQQWLYSLLSMGINIVSSDICDYEVRRGTLLSINSNLREQGLKKLDDLHDLINILPVSQPILRKAAELWAQNRRSISVYSTYILSLVKFHKTLMMQTVKQYI